VNESCKFLIDEIIKNNPVENNDNNEDEEKIIPTLNTNEKSNVTANENKCMNC
jgi:hypothetical protein